MWPSVAEFGRDIEVKYCTAMQMKRRGRIPDEYWVLVIKAAELHGYSLVSYAVLAEYSHQLKVLDSNACTDSTGESLSQA